MKLSKDVLPGIAVASHLLYQEILELMMRKGYFTRDEVIECLDSAVLAAEQLQSALDAGKSKKSGELSVPAAIAILESLRITLETRHPPENEPDEPARLDDP